MTTAAPAAATAIFDLDGTLTWHDTLVPYLLGFVARRPARWLSVVSVLAALMVFAVGKSSRDRCKERIIAACLAGASQAELTRHTERFVANLLRRGMRARALEVLEAHRASGARLVLLSASPDLYVNAIATRLGFHECLCTELLWNAQRLVGTFVSANRRAAEKARLVSALRDRRSGSMAAYANSSSDLHHLELVDHPVLVNGSARARRLAAARGIACEQWR